MAYDPYQPPGPPPPGYPQPLPYQPPPYQRPSSTGRTVALVVGAAAAALLLIPALIAVMVFASGTIVDDVERHPPFPTPPFLERVPHRVAADENGAGFTVPVPPHAEVTEGTRDRWLGHSRVNVDLGGERIAVATYPGSKVEMVEQALTETVTQLRPRGLDDVTTAGYYVVGEQRAYLQQLRVRRSTETEVWVAVFLQDHARWVVLYEGPAVADRVGTPPALNEVADGWQW